MNKLREWMAIFRIKRLIKDLPDNEKVNVVVQSVLHGIVEDELINILNERVSQKGTKERIDGK